MSNKQNKTKAGISSIFQEAKEIQVSFFANEDVELDRVPEAMEVTELNIDEVYPNPNQPRKNFDKNALSDLSESIKKHGVIQPIVVNKTHSGYMIIAGERRYRASLIAGKKTIPAVIKSYSDRIVKEVAIVENLQRENLNPIEEATAMKRLMEEFSLTQEELAERLGKSRSTIANTVRILNLDPEVITLVEQGKLSAGHARAIVSLPRQMQIATAKKTIDGGMSVRQVEKLVKDYFNPPEKKPKKTMGLLSAELRDLVSRMQRCFGTKVAAVGNDKKGRIYIDYYTTDDLERMLELTEILENCKKLY